MAALYDSINLYLPFNESSGVPVDYGPNNLTVSKTGTMGYATGMFGNGAVYTAGAGNYYSIANNVAMNVNAGSTVNFWVYVTSYLNGVVFSKIGAFPTGVRTEAAGGGHFLISEGGGNAVDLVTWVTTGAWHMITIVTDSSADWTAYVDGTSRGTGTWGYFWLGEAQALRFGAPASSFYDSSTAAANVSIDDFAIIGRAWSASDISAAYAAGDGAPLIADYSSTVRVTEWGNRQVFQRARGTNARTVSVAGTYSTGTPTRGRIRLQEYASSTEFKSWTNLDSFSASAGAFSGTFSWPVSEEWVNAQVELYDATNTLIGTSHLTTRRTGTGILVLQAGQSNKARMADQFSPGTPNDKTSVYNGLRSPFVSDTPVASGDWGVPIGDGEIEFLDKVQQGTGMLIGVLNYGLAGTGLTADVGSGTWGSEATTSPLGKALAGIVATGSDVEFMWWNQGEADALIGATKLAYMAAFKTMCERICDRLTNRPVGVLKILIDVTGVINDSGTTADAYLDTIRDAQYELALTFPGASVGSINIDLTLTDQYHYAGAGYLRMAKRGAQSMLFALGLVSYGSRGPRVLNVVHIAKREILVQVELSGGTRIVETDGGTDGGSLTGHAIAGYTISSTSFANGLSASLALSADFSATADYSYLKGCLPTRTNLIYDNTTPGGDTIGCPMMPVSARAVVSNSFSNKRRSGHSRARRAAIEKKRQAAAVIGNSAIVEHQPSTELGDEGSPTLTRAITRIAGVTNQPITERKPDA